jgi:hypothetical protein
MITLLLLLCEDVEAFDKMYSLIEPLAQRCSMISPLDRSYRTQATYNITENRRYDSETF